MGLYTQAYIYMLVCILTSESVHKIILNDANVASTSEVSLASYWQY
jgi:hypothetical protein